MNPNSLVSEGTKDSFERISDQQNTFTIVVDKVVKPSKMMQPVV